MALSNAERQARYRARLKQNASLDALGTRVGNLVDSAVETMWAVFSRPGPDGSAWAEVERFGNVDAWRQHLSDEPEVLVATARDLLWMAHLLGAEEKRVLETLVEVSDALAMRNA